MPIYIELRGEYKKKIQSNPAISFIVRTPRYFELIIVSLDQKFITENQPRYFELVGSARQTEYVRAQIGTHCILNELVLVCVLTLLLRYLMYNHGYFKKLVSRHVFHYKRNFFFSFPLELRNSGVRLYIYQFI